MEGDQNESDNDYSWETPRKKLNTSLDTMGISAVHLHGVAPNSWASTAKNKLDRAVEVLKTLSDAYVVSTDQLASSESVNVISETEQKASELDRLHNLMKEKLTTTTYSEKIQILTLAPDSWSCRYWAEHFTVSKYLERTARELKKVKGILAKPAQKQGKVISQNTNDLVLSMYEDDEFTQQISGKKTMLPLQKEFINRNVLFYATKEKCMLPSRKNILMLSLDFPNFAHFDQNGVYLLGLQVLILYVYAVSIKMQFYWLMQSIGISHTKI